MERRNTKATKIGAPTDRTMPTAIRVRAARPRRAGGTGGQSRPSRVGGSTNLTGRPMPLEKATRRCGGWWVLGWLGDVLRQHPELAVFLTLAIGFLIGRLRWRRSSLGAVTGTLLAGVLVGQSGAQIPDLVKTVAFLLFLFALGYRVGPQFFRGLRQDGLPQLALAAILCAIGLAVAVAAAKLLGYGPGWGAGLLAGGLTQSAAIGVATDAINALPIPDAAKRAYANQIPVGYAVCYLFGTAAAAWFLSSLAPRLIGTRDLAGESHQLETHMGMGRDPGVRPAYQPVTRRTYRIDDPAVDGTTAADLEDRADADGRRVYLYRIRHGHMVSTVTPTTVLHRGDVVTVSSTHADLIDAHLGRIGTETDDPELLGFDVETLDVVVTSRDVAGRTVGELLRSPEGQGIFVTSLTRAGVEVPWGDGTELHLGDELRVQGSEPETEHAAAAIGYANRSPSQTDMSYVGWGVFLGGLIGLPTLAIAGADIGLTTSGGALIMGLVFGWLRSRYPVFGQVPPGAQYLMDTVGLTVFVGVVGITAGPSFISGVRQEGLSLLLAGLVVTLTPMVAGLYLGKYLFRFPTPILLGVIAGSQTTTASIGAVTDAARSKVPVLGYTVPYAVGNTLLTIWGSVIVALLA